MKRIHAICDAIEAEFDAPREQIEHDVAELAAQFLDRKLIVPAAA